MMLIMMEMIWIDYDDLVTTKCVSIILILMMTMMVVVVVVVVVDGGGRSKKKFSDFAQNFFEMKFR